VGSVCGYATGGTAGQRVRELTIRAGFSSPGHRASIWRPRKEMLFDARDPKGADLESWR